MLGFQFPTVLLTKLLREKNWFMVHLRKLFLHLFWKEMLLGRHLLNLNGRRDATQKERRLNGRQYLTPISAAGTYGVLGTRRLSSPHNFLLDYWTLFQLEGADYAPHIDLFPPKFLMFRCLCQWWRKLRHSSK